MLVSFSNLYLTFCKDVGEYSMRLFICVPYSVYDENIFTGMLSRTMLELRNINKTTVVSVQLNWTMYKLFIYNYYITLKYRTFSNVLHQPVTVRSIKGLILLATKQGLRMMSFSLRIPMAAAVSCHLWVTLSTSIYTSNLPLVSVTYDRPNFRSRLGTLFWHNITEVMSMTQVTFGICTR